MDRLVSRHIDVSGSIAKVLAFKSAHIAAMAEAPADTVLFHCAVSNEDAISKRLTRVMSLQQVSQEAYIEEESVDIDTDTQTITFWYNTTSSNAVELVQALSRQHPDLLFYAKSLDSEDGSATYLRVQNGGEVIFDVHKDYDSRCAYEEYSD